MARFTCQRVLITEAPFGELDAGRGWINVLHDFSWWRNEPGFVQDRLPGMRAMPGEPTPITISSPRSLDSGRPRRDFSAFA